MGEGTNLLKVFLDHSLGFRDPAVLSQRHEMLESAATVQPLSAWVSALRLRRGADVPDFDPAEAGACARVLFVHESPGPGTSKENGTDEPGSGFISVDNNDQSASNMWDLLAEADLEPTETAQWNMVPWYSGPSRRSPNADELRAGARELRSLLPTFHRLEVIVLCGMAAKNGWAKNVAPYDPRRSIETWSPAPLAMKQPAKRAELLEALQRTRSLLGSPLACSCSLHHEANPCLPDSA